MITITKRGMGYVDFETSDGERFSAFRDGDVVAVPPPGSSFYPEVTPEIRRAGRELVGYTPPPRARVTERQKRTVECPECGRGAGRPCRSSRQPCASTIGGGWGGPPDLDRAHTARRGAYLRSGFAVMESAFLAAMDRAEGPLPAFSVAVPQ